MESSPLTLRPARPHETGALSALAFRSKGYWGYDEAFMRACRAELTLTPAYLLANPTFVAEREGRILGLYSFEMEDSDKPGRAELGLFFVDPDEIGGGIGRVMMEDAVRRALSLEMAGLVVQSDPHAEAFYRAMGFVRSGERPSESFPGRTLPLLERTLAAEG